MWQKIKSVTKALFKNPIRFIFDPGYYLEYQVTELEAQGRTAAEIDQTMAANGFLKGSPFDGITQALKDGFKVIDRTLGFFSNKNNLKAVFFVILFIVGLVIIWKLKLLRKAAA